MGPMSILGYHAAAFDGVWPLPSGNGAGLVVADFNAMASLTSSQHGRETHRRHLRLPSC